MRWVWERWGRQEGVSQAFLHNLGKVQDGGVGTLASAHGGGLCLIFSLWHMHS